MAEFWGVNRRITFLGQDTVLALPTTAVLPTHTAVFGKLSVMELMPFRICHVPVIHAFFWIDVSFSKKCEAGCSPH